MTHRLEEDQRITTIIFLSGAWAVAVLQGVRFQAPV